MKSYEESLDEIKQEDDEKEELYPKKKSTFSFQEMLEIYNNLNTK